MAAALMAACQPIVYDQEQIGQTQAMEAVQQVVEPLAASVESTETQTPLTQAFAPVNQQTDAPREESLAPNTEAMPQSAPPIESGAEAQPQAKQEQADVSTAFQGKQNRGPDSVKEQENAAVAQEAPVFGQLEAAPIKVAEAPAEPVELDAEEGMDQLAERVNDALEQGNSRVEVSLSPKNLGTLTVEITRAGDGSLSVVLNAAAPKAAALLEQHSGNLQNLLMANTQATVRVEVHGSQEGQQQFLNPDDSGRQGQQQSQQQEHRQQKNPQDFIQQLRLGLIDLEQAAV